MVDKEEWQCGEERPGISRFIDKHSESAWLWDERGVNTEVVARGAAQSSGMPGVVEGDLRGGHENHSRHVIAIRVAARSVAVVDHALACKPIGVAAAAGERPTAGNDVAAAWPTSGHRPADGAGRASGDAPRTPEFARKSLVCEAGEGGVLVADHHAPARRAIGAGDRFHNARRGDWIRL